MKLTVGYDYRKAKGYKYQTLRRIDVQTVFRPEAKITSTYGWVVLHTSGVLVVKRGYAWDGPSGPTFDTASTMRASLFHDALYQLQREGHLDPKECRAASDKLLRRLMLEDGAFKWRANAWLWAVHNFAKGAAYE